MTKPPRKPRTVAEYAADYRATHVELGLCRECTKPVKIKSTGEPAKLCYRHAAADAARKAASVAAKKGSRQ